MIREYHFLAKKAQELELGKAILLGKGSEVSGDRERASVLADTFEAVLGAFYTTSGLVAARTFLLSQLKTEMDNLSRDDYEDPKSLLQEYVQAKKDQGVHYELISSSGPSHAPQFTVGVYYGDRLLAEGVGSSKKESELQAARVALGNKDSWSEMLYD